jgi:hypothetical protein
MLRRLAAGSYDILLNGTLIGGAVRNISAGGDLRGWRGELRGDRPPEQRPLPFTKVEHRFGTLEAIAAWLGGAEITDNG